MELRDGLYTLTDRKVDSSGKIIYTLRLNADHYIYRAHFPGQPITPGVCIVQIVKELMEDHTGKPLSIRTVKNVKFLMVLSPVEIPTVTYEMVPSPLSDSFSLLNTQVMVSGGGQTVAKISMTLSDEDI